jgi:dephospho-CoA kinase
MMRPLQIGITGGIGSGKTLVCKIFQTLGVPVYDADSRAKALMTTDGILISAIKKEFGELSYKKDNTLDREYLGRTVFNDEDKLQVLNNLVHPRVGDDYDGWVTRQQSPYVLKEAALLFEAGSYKTLDRIIVVAAPLSIRMKRVLGRDRHRTEEQVRNIISHQLPEEEKMGMADFIIYNDESQLVITQVLELHQKFSAMPLDRTQ